MEQLSIKTGPGTNFVNITDQVHNAVKQFDVEEGVCCIYVPHTTAAVTINENTDPAVRRDMCMELDKLVPPEGGYAHIEGNSAAHIKSTIVGASISIPVLGGELQLGTWQDIFFCEFDGPRQRKAYVTAG